MRVLLDGQPIDVDPPTVARALDVARSQAERAGRLVIEAKGDGTPLDGPTLDHPPEHDAGLAELAFTSAAAGAFIAETLLSTAEALGAAGEDQRTAADAIQSGDRSAAAAPLQAALAAWAMAQDVVAKAGLLMGEDPAAIEYEVSGQPDRGASRINALRDLLEQIKAATQDDDWTAVADVLAYELTEENQAWQGFMAALAKQARARDAAT